MCMFVICITAYRPKRPACSQIITFVFCAIHITAITSIEHSTQRSHKEHYSTAHENISAYKRSKFYSAGIETKICDTHTRPTSATEYRP